MATTTVNSDSNTPADAADGRRRFIWKTALVNAFILMMYGVCHSLMGVVAGDSISKMQLIILISVGLSEFFGYLAIARGIKTIN
jgi:hypothetical protein